MTDLLKTLRRLDKAMTKRPWTARVSSDAAEVACEEKTPVVGWPGFDNCDRCWGEHAANAQGIADLRNLLPQIIEALTPKPERAN